jgi:hypothetical protein
MRFRNKYLKITTSTFIVLVFLASCKQESENIVKEPPKTPLKQINSGFKEEELFQKYIDDIDNNKDLTSGPTLKYLGDNETHVSALVFFDSEKSIKKIIFEEVRGEGSSEVCSYYFRGGGLFFHTSEKTEINDDSFVFSVTKSYLDSAENIVFACSKRHSDFDSLEFLEFQPIEKKNIDKSKILALVNQEGQFQTLFRGFSDFNGLKFLVVGTDDYTSTLEIDKNSSGDLAKLSKNPVGYMRKKLNLSFSNYTKEDKIEYQKLLRVKILEE